MVYKAMAFKTMAHKAMAYKFTATYLPETRLDVQNTTESLKNISLCTSPLPFVQNTMYSIINYDSTDRNGQSMRARAAFDEVSQWRAFCFC